MSTVVNHVTSNFISSSSYGAITDGISLLVIGILLLLLLERVIIDAYRGKPDEFRLAGFTMTILPLLFVMVIVIILRMAQILHL